MKTEQQLKDELKNLEVPLKVLMEELKLLHDIVNVSIRGISVTQALPNAMKVLADTERVADKKIDYEKSHAEASKIAEIAKNEIEKGFPFLYSQAALMLYAHLEGSIKRFIIEYFKNSKSILEIKEIAGLKMSFGEYHSLDEFERLDYLFSLYEKSVSIGMQYGVTRFESLLAPIGFNGNIDEKTRFSIFELSQIRNNLLHRGGVADKHLIKSCPHLKLSIGAKVVVTKTQYESFYSALCQYVLIIAIRLNEKRGHNVDEYKKLLID